MRLALLQCAPRCDGVAASLAHLGDAAERAAGEGANLLLTPEMYLTGYNIGLEAVQHLAEPADGEAMQAIGEIAQKHGTAILVGFPEACEGGAIYNSVQLISAQGERLGCYRKAHLFGDVDRTQFSAGPCLGPLVELDGWRCGMAICYDIEFPEVARNLTLQGAEAILVPTANMTPFDSVCLRLVPARAEENRLPVAYANYCGAEGAFAYCGLSCVCGPDGEDLARAGRDEEMIFATLSKEKLQQARETTTYLQDRRADIYR